ncbi:hypothetical protein BKA66DRAFT_514936 [Pyrenochaeta sp. MPI-SDFR-AT-0127]|nr:hypothetical protein BKA66DRAFT_514936 [Pyrenochaeta sp. MPI-SDFR-AT-0127]
MLFATSLDNPATDIHARLVHFDESLLQGLAPNTSSPVGEYPWSSTTLKSGGSSMAPALIHQPSTHPPSLCSYFTNTNTTITETSISTGLASRFHGLPLLEDRDGVLELPRAQVSSPVFECAFWFLSCGEIFENEEVWQTHCLSHFRGEEPPRSVQCPLCDWQTNCVDGNTAWSHRMHHIAHIHNMFGETLRTSRPDFHLFQYLWQRRLIDDQDLKELKGGNHNLAHPPGNFVQTNRTPREREREREGRQRRVQHVAPRRPHG